MTGTDSYRHTQWGWPMLALLPVMIAIPAIALAGTGSWWIVALISVVTGTIAAIFGALTVAVDASHIRLRFGVGLIRKAIPLNGVRDARIVRNPWYSGVGIRMVTNGWLYNVAGSMVVELDLPGGAIARIGSDEPHALLSAIRAAQPAIPLRNGHHRAPQTGLPWSLVVPICVVAAAGIMIYVQAQPPAAEFSGDLLRVSSGFYSSTIPVAEIEEVVVADSLPTMEARTNGFAMGGALRGQFRSKTMGRGMLYVNRGHPPYVTIRTNTSFVIIGFEDTARTRRLIAQLAGVGHR